MNYKVLCLLPCFNPECNNLITVTTQEKRNFLFSFAKRYDSTFLPTCSKQCAEALSTLLGSDYDKIAERAEQARENMRGPRKPQ